MSHIPPSHDVVVVVPEDQAEIVGGAPVIGGLYANSSLVQRVDQRRPVSVLGGGRPAAAHQPRRLISRGRPVWR